MTDIQRIIDSIPETEFLGAMTTEIIPKGLYTCLVCRFVSPDTPFDAGLVTVCEAAAERLELPYEDVRTLYAAANLYTAEIEEAIADRLNRIVR
jgi:hypothetical protein